MKKMFCGLLFVLGLCVAGTAWGNSNGNAALKHNMQVRARQIMEQNNTTREQAIHQVAREIAALPDAKLAALAENFGGELLLGVNPAGHSSAKQKKQKKEAAKGVSQSGAKEKENLRVLLRDPNNRRKMEMKVTGFLLNSLNN